MHTGRRPYESVAFQFSHHTVDQSGKITHQTQWLDTNIGVFPNFEFVRQLKSAIGHDNGSIFRYHNHENTILNAIYRQLAESNEDDATELCEFIRTITNNKSENHVGPRDMIDLYRLVLGGFYHLSMKGSNSIKDVLPAAIQASSYLQNKYSKPVYGTKEIPSLNLSNHTWLVPDGPGNFVSPYKTLPAIFEGIANEKLDELCADGEEELNDGGAAMMAYAKMQFTEMDQEARTRYREALLRYCELDTLAMVMIYEGWKHHLGNL